MWKITMLNVIPEKHNPNVHNPTQSNRCILPWFAACHADVLGSDLVWRGLRCCSGRSAGGESGLDSQKYVDKGLPVECADFVYVCMEGREGNAQMSEYFHMLEVCKQLFGVNDDNYYNVSTAVAGIMMGM